MENIKECKRDIFICYQINKEESPLHSVLREYMQDSYKCKTERENEESDKFIIEIISDLEKKLNK